jgi:hypothetical protein
VAPFWVCTMVIAGTGMDIKKPPRGGGFRR